MCQWPIGEPWREPQPRYNYVFPTYPPQPPLPLDVGRELLQTYAAYRQLVHDLWKALYPAPGEFSDTLPGELVDGLLEAADDTRKG